MNDTLGFLVRHGPAVLFVAVFIEQIGLPIPAAPVLLTAGALVVAGQISWMMALTAAVVGSLMADAMWFYFGRRSGKRVLRLLCRTPLERDSCVRRTQRFFTRYPFRFTMLGQLATIGHHTGVAAILGMKFSGFLAWLMWRTVYLLKLPRLPKKLRVVTGWTLDLLFSRDLEQMLTMRDVEALAQMAGRVRRRAAQRSTTTSLAERMSVPVFPQDRKTP
jgi:membrane protein YqaA with SNARE-associated domain